MSNIKAVKAFFYPNLAQMIILAQNEGYILQEGFDRYTVQLYKQGFWGNKNLLLRLDANGTVHISGPGGNSQSNRNRNTPVPEYYYRQLDWEQEESKNTRYFNCLFCGNRVKQGKGINGEWQHFVSCASCEHSFQIENGSMHIELPDAIFSVAAVVSHEFDRPVMTKAEKSILIRHTKHLDAIIPDAITAYCSSKDKIDEDQIDFYINCKRKRDDIPLKVCAEDIVWGLRREEIETNQIGLALVGILDMYIDLAFIENVGYENKQEFLQSIGDDLGLKPEYVKERIKKLTESLSQADKLYIKLAAKLAKIDGIVEKREVDEFKIVLEKMDYNSNQLNLARDVFNKAKTDVTDIDEIINEFSVKLVEELQDDESVSNIEMVVVGYLIGLIMITASDGKICSQEAEVIRKLEEKLNIEDGIVSKVLEGLNFDGMNMYEQYYNYLILEVATDATDDEVKHAFRSKSKDYHPDRIHSMNLHDDFKKLAEKKFSELRTAYNEIMEHRRIYGTK